MQMVVFHGIFSASVTNRYLGLLFSVNEQYSRPYL